MNVERKPVFGSHLVIPLKYDGEFAAVAAELAHEPLTTMDLTENVKAMLSGEGDSAVGRCCRIEAERIRDCLTEEQEAIEAKRTDRMSNIITVFGLISILDSVISIVSALKEGDPILWHCSTATASAVLVLLLLASRPKKQ